MEKQQMTLAGTLAAVADIAGRHRLGSKVRIDDVGSDLDEIEAKLEQAEQDEAERQPQAAAKRKL